MEGCCDGLLLAASIDLPSMLVFYFFLPLMPASNCIYVTLYSASFFSNKENVPATSAICKTAPSASLPPAVQEGRPPVLLPNHHDESSSSLLDLPSSIEDPADEFATTLPSDITVEVLADIMNTTIDLLGDETTTSHLKNLTFTGTSHAKKQSSFEARFFLVLSCHPRFKPLTEIMNDPDIPSKKTRKFYVMLRNTMTPSKKMVLNFALLCYSQSLVKKEYEGKDLTDPQVFAEAQYQPNSLETHFKVLFSVLKRNQIHYQLQKDFNGPGDFQAYWKHAMGVAAIHRPLDYARKPNASVPDMSQKKKIRAQLEDGRLDPFNVYDDMMMVLADSVLTTFILRGGREVSTLEMKSTIMFPTHHCAANNSILFLLTILHSRFIWKTPILISE